ncbi:hypothetical protein RRG08_038924 [Elysia crispata]|uniref:Uncharacterized protein n=1 Tax=Elysia crispata TaxID=231223 RepID=A0AAE0Y8F5_9GAST|nr:hypothetical protein RRG08_038924 [Elysia crispata]
MCCINGRDSPNRVKRPSYKTPSTVGGCSVALSAPISEHADPRKSRQTRHAVTTSAPVSEGWRHSFPGTK